MAGDQFSDGLLAIPTFARTKRSAIAVLCLGLSLPSNGRKFLTLYCSLCRLGEND